MRRYHSVPAAERKQPTPLVVPPIPTRAFDPDFVSAVIDVVCALPAPARQVGFSPSGPALSTTVLPGPDDDYERGHMSLSCKQADATDLGDIGHWRCHDERWCVCACHGVMGDT
jgi:hypothetical protein